MVIKRFFKKRKKKKKEAWQWRVQGGGAENREMNKNNDLKAFFFFFWFSASLSADAQLSQCSWLPDKCGKISQFELVVSSPGTEAQINEGLPQVW